MKCQTKQEKERESYRKICRHIDIVIRMCHDLPEASSDGAASLLYLQQLVGRVRAQGLGGVDNDQVWQIFMEAARASPAGVYSAINPPRKIFNEAVRALQRVAKHQPPFHREEFLEYFGHLRACFENKISRV